MPYRTGLDYGREEIPGDGTEMDHLYSVARSLRRSGIRITLMG